MPSLNSNAPHQLMQMAGLSKEPQPEAVNALDVIFSCCVCNATFAEAYEDCGSVQQLSDGINPKDRLVTRMFLAGCCHVFCSRHLEGGGAPFHPQGQRPRAPCPMCTKDGELYSIRGFKQGQYDSAIPECWFTTPPMKLDSSGKEMEALRFQYMSLVTYAKQVTIERMRFNDELADARNKLDRVEKSASDEMSRIHRLEQEVQRLRSCEQELQKFKDRQPDIQHYLGLIPKLVDQNKQMSQRLASLGFQMHFEPLKSEKPFYLPDRDDRREDAPAHAADHSRTASNYTGHRSADTLVDPDAPMTSSPQTRPLKRQRVESPLPAQNIHARMKQQQNIGSRDRMPPPSKPLSRMKSFKKYFPTLRKKGYNGHSSSRMDNDSASGQSMQMLETRGITEEDALSVDVEERNLQHPSRYADGNWQSNSHYMTGALPASPEPKPSQVPPQQSGLGLHGPPTEFSFRSPLPSHSARPTLPNEPSYMRLMDGLSRDTGLDLGLSDPRRDPFPQPNRQNSQFVDGRQAQFRAHGANGHTHWNLGHPFLHQSPEGPPTSSYRLPDPLRSNPTINGSQVLQHNSSPHAVAPAAQQPRHNQQHDPITPAPQHSHYHRTLNPVTPAPHRPQHLTQFEESVVSPFFKSSDRSSHRLLGVNETDDSLPQHSDAYPSRKQGMQMVRAGRHETRGLNGLSFFDSPRNTNNEPITHEWGLVPHVQRYTPRNVTSRGLIKRPDDVQLPLFSSSADRSLQRALYSRHAPALSQSTMPFRSSSQQPSSRVTRLPPSVPSNISSQRTSRAPRTENHGVVRKSRPSELPRSHIRSSAFVQPTRNLFSSAGRRSIVR